MSRAEENAGFVCAHCGQVVQPLTNGSFRNHCPWCLWSKHVDDKPGDRAVHCCGLMRPVGIELSKKGWRLVHECRRCRVVRVNRIAQLTVQPDDIDALVRLVNGPKTTPNRPFGARGESEAFITQARDAC